MKGKIPTRHSSTRGISKVQKLLNALAITDTSNHYSFVFAPVFGKRVTFLANSSLNQAVTCRLFGSKDNGVGSASGKDPSGALTNSYPLTGATAAITLPSDPAPPANSSYNTLGSITDYHKYFQWRVVASVAPTSGTIDIWALEGP